MKSRKRTSKRPAMPASIAAIKRAIKALPDSKIEPLVKWLLKHYDDPVWDRQMKADAKRLGGVGFGVALGAKATGNPDGPLDFGELHDIDEVFAKSASTRAQAKKAEKISKRLVEWAEAAKFEGVECQCVGTNEVFKLEFGIGKNVECSSVAGIKKHLGYIVRGAGFKIADGECVVTIDGDRVRAWFKLEPREEAPPPPKWRGPSKPGQPYRTDPL
ncbi:MAG: hypothetical protein WCH99_12205 [Verrucomicrobiota bacterium]